MTGDRPYVFEVPTAPVATASAREGEATSSRCEAAVDAALELALDEAEQDKYRDEYAARNGAGAAALFESHVQGLFSSTTRSAARVKALDWKMFCTLILEDGVHLTKPDDMQWPPERGQWLQFLHGARTRVRSQEPRG